MPYHVTVNLVTLYILRFCDDSFYVGITKDLKKRLAIHQRSKGNFVLFHKEFYPDYKSARIREKYYKKLNRARLIVEVTR